MFSATTMKERTIRAGIASPDQIRGCSENEIESIENSFRVKLPSAYKEFLSAFGHSAGRFWYEADFAADKLPEINRKARAILEESDAGLELPPRGFVFALRYEEQFLFFLADGKSDNPPTFRYLFGNTQFVKTHDVFWDAIEGVLEVYEQVFQSLPAGIFPWIK